MTFARLGTRDKRWAGTMEHAEVICRQARLPQIVGTRIAGFGH